MIDISTSRPLTKVSLKNERSAFVHLSMWHANNLVNGWHSFRDPFPEITNMRRSAGAVTGPSNKQTINIPKIPRYKSFTESKLVAVHDKFGDILWTRHYFLAARGCTISANIYLSR